MYMEVKQRKMAQKNKCGWVEWSLEAEPVEEEKNDPINIEISELNEKKMKQTKKPKVEILGDGAESFNQKGRGS